MKKKSNRLASRKHTRLLDGVISDAGVWTAEQFVAELSNRVPPTKLADRDLLNFCRNAYKFEVHYLHELRPFFKELWKRIGPRRIPGALTRPQVCKAIGCSIRRVQEILAETTEKPKKHTDEEFAREIKDYAHELLASLLSLHWDRYQGVCYRLAAIFDKHSKGVEESGDLVSSPNGNVGGG